MEDLSYLANAPAPRRKKKNVTFALTKWFVFALFVFYAATLLFPFLWMLLNSFKSGNDFNGSGADFAANVFGWPREFYGKNFIEIMTFEIDGETVWSMFINSIIVTVLGTIINVFLSACAAYALAKYRFPGSKIIYGLAIFSMVVPIVGTLPSQVVMMETLGIDDSLLGILFLYSGCFGFNFVMLYSAFRSISWSYAEAASMDGAGRFKIFFKVMLPMAKGPILACSILQAITLWNDYSTPFLFWPSHQTLAVGLYNIQEAQSGNPPAIFATMIVAVVPVLVLYACFQKKIIENTNAGGLKG